MKLLPKIRDDQCTFEGGGLKVTVVFCCPDGNWMAHLTPS